MPTLGLVLGVTPTEGAEEFKITLQKCELSDKTLDGIHEYNYMDLCLESSPQDLSWIQNTTNCRM